MPLVKQRPVPAENAETSAGAGRITGKRQFVRSKQILKNPYSMRSFEDKRHLLYIHYFWEHSTCIILGNSLYC